MALTEQDLYRVLDEQSIDFDRESVREGVVEGILRALDNRARILSTNDAALLTNAVAIDAAEAWAEDIGYLKINGLVDGAGTEIVRKILAWRDDGLMGLVLDLRGAGGNDMASVESIVTRFALVDEELYRVRDGEGHIVDTFSGVTNRVDRIPVPLMILVDRKTSGASEILAAVLKGEDRVLLIGEKTEGHRGLMEVVPVTNTEFLYVATRWVLLGESGESIDDGVIPDIVVERQKKVDVDLPTPVRSLQGKSLSEKAIVDRDLMERVAGDVTLRRATDILLGLKALGAFGFEQKPLANEEK